MFCCEFVNFLRATLNRTPPGECICSMIMGDNDHSNPLKTMELYWIS